LEGQNFGLNTVETSLEHRSRHRRELARASPATFVGASVPCSFLGCLSAAFACGSVAFRKRRQLSSFRKHMPGVSGTFAPPTAAAAKLI